MVSKFAAYSSWSLFDNVLTKLKVYENDQQDATV